MQKKTKNNRVWNSQRPWHLKERNRSNCYTISWLAGVLALNWCRQKVRAACRHKRKNMKNTCCAKFNSIMNNNTFATLHLFDIWYNDFTPLLTIMAISDFLSFLALREFHLFSISPNECSTIHLDKLTRYPLHFISLFVLTSNCLVIV